MIRRFSGRASFERIARDGSRARAGVLWCTYVLDPLESPPQVAFAIGRAVGPAVARNRLRRQLRALLDTRQPHHIVLPAGLYLVGVAPGTASRSSTELMFDLSRIMDRITTRVARRPALPDHD